MPTLSEQLDRWLPGLRRQVPSLKLQPRLEQIGKVEQVGDSVALVSGLADCRLDELLVFPGGVTGLAASLDRERIGCILFGPESEVAAGATVHGTGDVVDRSFLEE